MIPVNILNIKDRAQFRQWLIENHATERECCGSGEAWQNSARGRALVS